MVSIISEPSVSEPKDEFPRSIVDLLLDPRIDEGPSQRDIELDSVGFDSLRYDLTELRFKKRDWELKKGWEHPWPVSWFINRRISTYKKRIDDIVKEVRRPIEEEGFSVPDYKWIQASLILGEREYPGLPELYYLRTRSQANVVPVSMLIENMHKYEGQIVVTEGIPHKIVDSEEFEGLNRHEKVKLIKKKRNNGEGIDIDDIIINQTGTPLMLRVHMSSANYGKRAHFGEVVNNNGSYKFVNYTPSTMYACLEDADKIVVAGLVKDGRLNADMFLVWRGEQPRAFTYAHLYSPPKALY